MTTFRALVRAQVSDIIGTDRLPARRVRATLSRLLTAAETGLQSAEQHYETINADRIKTHEGLAPLFRRTDQTLHARENPFRRCVVCLERQVVEARVDHCADPLCRKTLVDSEAVWKDVNDRWAIAAEGIQQARRKIARAQQAQEYGAMELRDLAEQLVQEDSRATDPSLTPEERAAAEAAYATALEVWFQVLEAYDALPRQHCVVCGLPLILGADAQTCDRVCAKAYDPEALAEAGSACTWCGRWFTYSGPALRDQLDPDLEISPEYCSKECLRTDPAAWVRYAPVAWAAVERQPAPPLTVRARRLAAEELTN